MRSLILQLEGLISEWEVHLTKHSSLALVFLDQHINVFIESIAMKFRPGTLYISYSASDYIYVLYMV